jgi:hypothetical protein
MSEAVATAAPSGLVLGRYRPLKPLGSGGSGSVWLARDETNGLDVALKIVPRDGNAAARAEREAAAAARLRHAHCLRAYGLARDGRHVYIAYEYVPGGTLRQALRAGEVNDAAAVEAAAQILEGLAHAHAHGIVHRDVKPSNVLVADGDSLSIRLLDFGLAQIREEESLTAPGDVPGTLAYISPERLRGEQAQPAADVWSVGVVLWESLAGHHPFWTSALLQTADRIQSGAPSLASQRPDLPDELIRLVDSALALDPAARPTAAKLAAALRIASQPRERIEVRPQVALGPLAAKAAPAVAAAFFAGWSAEALPFFPAGWWLGLAAVAAAVTALRPRLGLMVALAVPVFPLGNISLGLSTAYGAAAAAWLLFFWQKPRSGLFLAAGPLLAPLALLGLLPLASQVVSGRMRRAIQVVAAVLGAAVVAWLQNGTVPFTGAGSPGALGIPGSEEPFAVASALAGAIASRPQLLLEALVLGAAAAALPLAQRHGRWGITGFGAALLTGTLLAAPAASAVPLVLAAWATCVVLAVKAER